MQEGYSDIEQLAQELAAENKKTIDPLLDVIEADNVGQGSQAFWSIFSVGSSFALFMGMILLNIGIGLFLLIKLLFSGAFLSSVTLLIGGALLIALPAAYLFIGYRYSAKKIVFELYRNVLKTLLQKLVTLLVSKLAQNLGLSGDGSTKKNQVVQTIKNYIESIMNRIPKMLHKYLNVANLANQTVDGVYEMSTEDGLNNTLVERCADMVFNKFDKQLEDQLKPSLTPFFVVLGLNLVVAVTIWSML